ncbi:MAG: site-specific integrase [Bacillota bacterium]|nr:site-specific integrase [Bacillota bacterium]
MPHKVAPRFEQAFSEFLDSRIIENLSLSTINRDIGCLNKLSNYLENIDVKAIDELESTHLVGFVKSMSRSRQLPSLCGLVSSLRLVLSYLHINQYLTVDLSKHVPKVKAKPDGIPSVYSEDEVERMLGIIDRASPKGKRDYAMCLLAARLGMRASDICELTFVNLKWQRSTIEFFVKKTGKSAVLPLLDEVGESLIEYLRHGRPESTDNHVFLRLQKPYGKLLPSVLHSIVAQSFRGAGISLLPGRRQGPHSLRASLASAMLNKNTPLPVISEALTHSNTDTTLVYLKIDISHLRNYALDVPPLANVWMGGVPR